MVIISVQYYIIIFFINSCTNFHYNGYTIEKLKSTFIIKEISVPCDIIFSAYAKIIIKKQYYTFNTLIICSSASL